MFYPRRIYWDQLAMVVTLLACTSGWLAACPAAELQPLGVEQFFVAPRTPVVLQWRIASGPAEPVEYRVRDYGDGDVQSGQLQPSSDNRIDLPLRLETGYYEVAFPASGQRFGLAVLPAFSGERDPFFAIDAALSWLVDDAALRRDLIRILGRSGVGMARERLGWAAISPAEDTMVWDGTARYETIRHDYADRDVAVLEMFHDTPAWLGRVAKYPADLVLAERQWRAIAERWQATWGAVEVWNEPDIFFGGDLPADQYVPLVNRMARCLDTAGIPKPVVGGAFAHFNEAYLDTAADNGLLEVIDALSFHTYARAPDMESLVARYRHWLQGRQRGDMPLWLTECGRPWQRGQDRPPREQDAESALDIVMKSVEARACGVARHFPFVYPYYEERDNNFGMMGRRGTPLRSMVGYAQLVRSLAHKPYLGDLVPAAEGLVRARLFGDQHAVVAILYTARAEPGAFLPLELPVQRVEGLDGRRLDAERGRIPIPDGLSYVWLDPRQIDALRNGRTPAMQLWQASRAASRRRAAAGGLALRLEIDRDWMVPVSEGYRLAAGHRGATTLRVRAFNLTSQAESLGLTLEGPVPLAGGSARASVQVPPLAAADVTWAVDLAAALKDRALVEVRVTAEADGDGPIRPLVARFLAPADAP